MQVVWMSSSERNKFLGEENDRVKGWIGLMKKYGQGPIRDCS